MDQQIINVFSQLIVTYLVTFALSFLFGIGIVKFFPRIKEIAKKITFKKAFIAVAGLVIIYVVFFSIFSIIRLESFSPGIFDMANMEQAVWNTAHGNILKMTTYYPYTNRLFFHVEPIMIIIAPLYLLWQDPKMLLIIQSFILGLGAIPVFLIAKEKLKNNLVALLLAGAYLLNPALHQGNITDFHPLVLAVTFILFGFYFAMKNKWGTSFLFFILAIFCREEIAVMVFLFGLYFFFSKNKKWGTIIGLSGLAWTLIALMVIMPAFSETGTPLQYEKYSRFGETPLEVVKYIILNPLSIFELYNGLGQLNYILFLLVPLALTSIFSPALLLTGLFSIATIFLSDNASLLAGLYQYNAPLVAPLFLSNIFGIVWLARKIKRYSPETTILTLSIVILLISFQLIVLHQWTQLSFKSKLLTNYTPEKIEAAREGIKLIPDQASVVTSWRLGPHVASRENLYLIDTPYRKTADYIFINRTPDIPCAKKWEGPKFCEATFDDYQNYLEEIQGSSNYQLIFEKENILLFKRQVTK